jgi:hypothetical protein
MSGDAHNPGPCSAMADDLPLLALGTLSGRSRSAVLDHVESCARCRTELEQLSAVAEALQQLTPEVQPPLGFELRLLERLQAAPTPRRRSRRLVVLSAAAAALVVVSLGLGLLVHRWTAGVSDRSVASAPATANLTSGGEVVGSVLVAPGSPAWMLVTVEGGKWQGTVTCEVTLADGQVATVGTFALTGGYPSWAAPLPATGGAVRSARLIDSNGATVASARFRVWAPE